MFYTIPEIHKPKAPERPAVYHLQPIRKEIPSYVKDPNDFLNKIGNVKYKEVLEDNYLVTMAVKSLNTNTKN